MISCIVFDFDGTLVDSNSAKRGAFYEVLVPLGLEASQVDGIFLRNPDADRHGIMDEAAELISAGGRHITSIDLAELYSHRALQAQVHAPEIPGASQLLEALLGRLPVYLNSATPETALVQAVSFRGWSQFFRGIYGRPASKEQNLEKIVNQERLPPSSVLMVGDQAADEKAAMARDCQFVAVGGHLSPAYGCRADALLDILKLI